MKKTLVLIALILSLSDYVYSQDTTPQFYPWRSELMKSDVDFYTVQKKANQYFDQMPDSVIGKQRKFFNRAAYFFLTCPL